MKRFALRGIAATMMAMILGTAGALAQTDAPVAVRHFAKSADEATDSAVAVPKMTFDGVGPVVMGSVAYLNLPNRTRKFLDKHCDGAAVVRCDKVYTTGEYEISLADGIEMTFSKLGDLVEIEAPLGYSFASNLVKAILPRHTYKSLKKRGLDTHVAEIVHDQYGYRINFKGSMAVNEVLFNHSGDYVASYKD